MHQLIYRQNHQFCINKELIKPQFQTLEVINGLYAAIYDEFKGAIQNDKYSKLTPSEKIQRINEFAYAWLTQRGFI
jgi:hypothetical protein